MKKLITLKIILAFFMLINLSACSSINSTVGGFFNMDTDLEIKFKVDSDINPDDDKKPSPLFVRMYELKSNKMFSKANFIDIYEKDEEVLGADMLAKQRLRRLVPGESRNENFVLNKETRFIGLYAEFFQFKKSGFKLIVPVVPTNVIGTSAEILIAGNKLIHVDASNNIEKDDERKKNMDKAAKNAKENVDSANAAVEKADKLKSLF